MALPSILLQQQKTRLRASMRVIRETYAETNTVNSQKMADVFLQNILLNDNAVVASYQAFRDEIDPSYLVEKLRAQGHTIVLPLIHGKRELLSFHLHRTGDILVPNLKGIYEPSPSSPLTDPDVLLVPLLAFDKNRNRLGYGGGYYDRTLMDLRSRKQTIAIGIGYAYQEVDEVPIGPNDVQLDLIVTDVNIF